MTDDSRMVLKELNEAITKLGWHKEETKYTEEGAGSSARFKAELFIQDESGTPNITEAGFGKSKKEAEISAAEAVLNSSMFRAATEQFASLQEDAWLGDAALTFFLALLGVKHKLSAEHMHNISVELFSNKALSLHVVEAEGRAVRTRGTKFEARVGAAVRTSSPNLEQLLEKALQLTYPELLHALQAKMGAA